MSTDVLQIRYVSNNGNTQVFSVGEDIKIGRAFFCDVHVQDLLASREHARFFRRDNLYWVEDLNSSNGSYLNGRRLLESTRIDDGDVLSIGQCTFTVERVPAVKMNQPTVVYTKRVLEQVQKSTKKTEVTTSRLFQRLMVLPTCKTLLQLCTHFESVLKECLPIANIEFWVSSSQSMFGLKRVSVDGISVFSFDDLDVTKQQMIWKEQAALIFESSEQHSSGADCTVAVPIVSNNRSVGVLSATIDQPSADTLAVLIVALYGFTKEWMVLEPWMNKHIARTPFVTTLQWMLAPMSSTNSLDIFQQQHQLRCTTLQFLSKDVSWSERERYAVECAMAMIQNQSNQVFFDQQRAWFDQSDDLFVRELLEIVDGYTGRSVTDHKGIDLMRLSLCIVDTCLEDPYIATHEMMGRLSTVMDTQVLMVNEADLDILLPMLHRIQHQEEDTQLFQR